MWLKWHRATCAGYSHTCEIWIRSYCLRVIFPVLISYYRYRSGTHGANTRGGWGKGAWTFREWSLCLRKVRDVGSWSGQNHFSSGGSQTKPHLQTTDRKSNSWVPGGQEKRSCASAPSRAWEPGPPSSIPGCFLRVCLTLFGSSIKLTVKKWIRLLKSTPSEWRQAEVVTDFSIQPWLWGSMQIEQAVAKLTLCAPSLCCHPVSLSKGMASRRHYRVIKKHYVSLGLSWNKPLYLNLETACGF